MTAARTTRVAAPKPKSASEKTIKPGLVCTFYSYKGGVGRSMALANVAIMLSRWGQRVLLIDWDLEAPGLERFFGMRLHGSRANQPGLIDLINSYDVENSATDGAPVDWRECRLKVSVPQGETIDIIHAGREGETYTSQLRALNWDRLFAQGFGRQLEDLRDEWRAQYDYVLVDSRTGITDIGGICSILLPDYLVSLFTTTEQSVLGVKDTMVRARTAQKELPLDRQRLIIIPIAARDESNTEYERAAEWRKRFARQLSGFYDDWIHKDETAESVLDYLKIPYVAFWSFGESLPVLEEDPGNPKTLAYSYALIARLIHGRLNWAEVKGGREATELEAQQAAEVQTRLAEANKVRIEAIARQQEEKERALEQRKNLLLERFQELRLQSRRRQHLCDVAIALLVLAAAALISGYVIANYYLLVPAKGATDLSYPLLVGIGGIFALIAILPFPGRLRAARIVSALDREYAAYTIGHGRYAGIPSDLGLLTFGDRIERIAEDQNPDQPEAQAPAAASPGSLSGPPVSLPAPPGTGAGGGMPLPSVGTGSSDGSGTNPFLSSKSQDNHSPIDVFFSAPASGISRDWSIEFAPLFARWLSEMLGRDVTIFSDAIVAPGENWAEAVDRAITRARTAVVVLSRRNLQSESGRRELTTLTKRLPPHYIFPLRLESIRTEDVPPELGRIQWTDFSDVAYVGEGFAKSERYIEFQDRIRELAKRVAAVIEKGDERTVPAA